MTLPKSRRRRTPKEKRELLIRLMDTHEMTSERVADLLEVHPVTVRRWRTQEQVIPAAFLAMLESHCARVN